MDKSPKKAKAAHISVREERFLQLIAAGTCKNQTEAWRQAYSSRGSTNSIKVKASVLLATPKAKRRIAELMQPLLDEVFVTRRAWLQKMQAFFYSDVRKMFDEFGNPIEIPELGDNEAAMVEGFEFCEDYTKVKKSNGSTEAIPTGYIKKYKLTPKIKAMLEFGKVMGWCEEGDGSASEQAKPPVNITVNFVETPRGHHPQPVLIVPQTQIEPTARIESPSPRVSLVAYKR
jgi:hypothetical protein